MLTAMEVKNRSFLTTKYGLAVTIDAREKGFNDVFFELRKKIRDFLQLHEEKAEFITISVTANSTEHVAVQEQLQRLYDADAELQKLIQKVRLELMLLNEKAKHVRKHRFEHLPVVTA